MQGPEELTFKDLREITNGFSEKVGEGGFGTVYKGVAKTGKQVAVKILRDVISDPNHEQFRNEFRNLMKVQHDNIVQLLGYCCERTQTRVECNGRIVLAENTHRALCFEFMHNGSLQTHLSDESHGLDWDTRYNIIRGTCEGLRYIHEDLEESLLHLDLKPDNILLDKNMVPKIADFGLSRMFGDQQTRATQISLGTVGYKPPEYIDNKEFSKKFDIFSLGVIIIKIVSGPESYPKCLDKPSDEFVDQVRKKWRKRWQATCSSDFSLEACCRQVQTCTQIALDCLKDDSQKRPGIVKIIEELNKFELGINKNYLEILSPTKRRRETMCGIVERDNREETSFDAGKELILGREEIKKRMVSSIESMPEKIVILPIYGIGGIGKTTFARLIYNDTKLKYYLQVWVYVPPRFDLCKIGNSIISQLSGKDNQSNDLELIKCCLRKLFSGKKILIVLDDLWENNTIQLMDLKDMLDPGDSIKTIVLITTRSEDIAKKMCINIEPYKIEALTDEICWDIIKLKSAFEARRDKEKLVCIGKDIARKCGGVALAAQTLGSMLQSMEEYDQWISVRDSYIWNETISNDLSLPNHVLASLKLSYDCMDDCLKLCFTYCAIFPKGHKIVEHDLIYQWISLGFIKPTSLYSPAQLCERYIVRLLGLSFLQYSMSLATYQQYGVHDTLFTMHDLVHDLATSLLGDEILDQSRPGSTRGSSSRYALLLDCSKPLESCMASPARLSALRFLDCQGTVLHGSAFESAESLRVLDLSECSVQKLPDSVSRLKQLRYLNAPRIRDQMFLECITTLSNLRYLSLRGSCAMVALPESIGRMEGLVHLDLSGCLGLMVLPESFGNLISLEHLDFSYCKKVMRLSQYLARFTKLQLLNLSKCEYIEEDLSIAFGSLTELRYLNLSDSSCLRGSIHFNAEYLDSLAKLRYLNLSSREKFTSRERFDIFWLPEYLGSLTQLKHLDLSSNREMEELPTSFGNICNLVHLDLSRCSNLRDVPAALDGLTKLQYLDLSQCHCHSYNAIAELIQVFGNLSELQHLNLCGCINMPFSDADPATDLLGQICTLINLEYLNLGHNDNIRCIPETLANLRKLHTLDISFTGIRRLPAFISEIDSLKFLYTMNCQMLDRSTTIPPYTTNSRIPPNFVSHTGGDESNKYPFRLEYIDHDGLKLKISRLEKVKSAKEARTMRLREKTDVTRLELEWTRDAKRFVDDAEVLRELEPPYSVSQLYLEGYNSVSFPPWVMHINNYLPGLIKIEMSDLPSCNNLPPLGQLPYLKHLVVRRMDGIKKIGVDLYGPPEFPFLSELVIDDMDCLEEWNTSVSGDEHSLYESSHIFKVKIRRCPRLRFKERPPQCRWLEIENSDEVLLSSLGNRGQASASAIKHLLVDCCVVPLHRWSLLRQLPRLEELTILDCSDLTCSSPDFLRRLTSLQSLTVRRCQSIVSLPERLGDLTSLTELKICACRGIMTLPDSIQKLCLRTLEVVSCESLVSLPEWLGDITSLRALEIFGCSGIETLPESLQQLTILWKLTLGNCASITSLPEGLGDLASLSKLEILGCRGIKTLPDTIQKLTRLKHLKITGCPELVQWCESKENKMKLAHIKKCYLKV